MKYVSRCIYLKKVSDTDCAYPEIETIEAVSMYVMHLHF